MKPYTTIIWATDGSEGANASLADAIGLAEVAGAHLIAAHCDQRLRGRAADWPTFADEDDIAERIREQVAELERNGVDIELVVRHSHHEAADVVADLARMRNADLIVCGTRGRGAIGYFFLGSFTHRLLHISPCAVLAVPGHATARAAAGHEHAEVSG
jgi:nucleotide-binding universal stress UspA family protein